MYPPREVVGYGSQGHEQMAQHRVPPQDFRARLGSVRPISVLRFWTSEGLTQAESESQGVEFSGP